MRLLLLLLLAPFGAFAQSTPMYLAGGLTNFSDQMIRQTNPVYVTRVGTDSVVISCSANGLQYASEYKRVAGEPFFRRTQQWSYSLENYLFLYEKALVMVEEGGSYLMFHVDRNLANSCLIATDQSNAIHLKDSLRAIVIPIVRKERAQNDQLAAARNKKIVTAYIRTLTSKRDDPTLVRDIKKWSQNETTVVYIVDANYAIIRNYRGEVLNKNIAAIIKYHLNGKCFIQWQGFGYEALGGGNFGKDLNTYNKQDYYLNATGAGGTLRLEAGQAYEIDCN